MLQAHDLIVAGPLLLIGFVHRRIAQKGAFFLVLSNLPITILHELAHFTAALLLGGRPTGVSLWPSHNNGKWRLGSVTARATILSAAPTALAPLVWLAVGVLLLCERGPLASGSPLTLFTVYVAAYLCLAACIPSWQDIRIALANPLSLILWGTLLAAADILVG